MPRLGYKQFEHMPPNPTFAGNMRKLVAQWAHSLRRLQQLAVSVEGFQLTLLFGFVAALFFVHPITGTNIGRVLLVAYWALNLPRLARILER